MPFKKLVVATAFATLGLGFGSIAMADEHVDQCLADAKSHEADNFDEAKATAVCTCLADKVAADADLGAELQAVKAETPAGPLPEPTQEQLDEFAAKYPKANAALQECNAG